MTQTALDLVHAAKAIISEVSVEQAKMMLNRDAIALDVREQHEVDEGKINDARHIPRGFIEFKIREHPDFVDLNSPIIVYCKTGGRSALTTATLQQLGYRNVYSLAGGFDAWQAETHKQMQSQQQ